jgi:hypothetical protein
LDEGTGRGWVLIDDGSARRFGPALVWAWRHAVKDLHVLVEGPAAAGVVARRAAELATPPAVWTVSGRSLAPAVVAEPASAGPVDLAWAEVLAAHGADAVVEHGVLRGEVLGLEVARVVDGGRLEVGVGRHDRQARAQLWGDFDPGGALDEAVAAVRARRRAGAAAHPANTLARSRWLRAVVCAQPSLAGVARLSPVPPPLPLPDLTDNGAVPCVGDGLVVVCSTGVDPDLVPTAADARHLYQPDGRLVIVVPAGDDHPVTVALARALARPALVRTVPRGWEGLGPSGP